MPSFSLDRDLVFTPDERPVYLYGHFPDFYAMLRAPRDATHAELENAILEAGSQMLAATLARGAGERLRLLHSYLPLLRRALLSPPMRARYDALLNFYQDMYCPRGVVELEQAATRSGVETEGAEFLALLWAQEEAAQAAMTRASSPLRRWLRRGVGA